MRSTAAVVLMVLAGAVCAAARVSEQVQALDAKFAQALKAGDAEAHEARLREARALIDSLGKNPVDPCRAAAIHLESARSVQWMTRNSADPAYLRINESNLRDARDWLAKCRADGR